MKSQFAAYMVAWRNARELTREKAADAAGISLSAWGSYEAGRMPGEKGIAKLAAHFGCSEAKLARMVGTPCEPGTFETANIAAVDAVFAGWGS